MLELVDMNISSQNFRIIILVVTSVPKLIIRSSAADKQDAVVFKPVQIKYDEHVLKLGRLQNYFSNNTNDIVSNRNYRSFNIGKADHQYPSRR